MKLRNKLIPIISAATVAATIAPISSCAIGQTTVNLINGYTPSIKKAVWEDYKANKADMLSFYASAVNENPEIFAQDMYWKYCVERFYNLDNGSDVDAWISGDNICIDQWTYDLVSISKFDALVDNVQVKKLTCFYDDETTKERTEVNYYTISFDLQIHMSYVLNESINYFEWDTDSEELSYYYNKNQKSENDYTTKISAKNIPITINRDLTRVYRGEQEFVDYDPFWIWWALDESFSGGYLSTSWIVQPMLSINYDASTKTVKGFNHDAFTHLEKNGYEWKFGISYEGTEIDTPYDTMESETQTYNRNFEFNEDSQFDQASTDLAAWWSGPSDMTLELYLARSIYSWYLPSFYLSDIEDINEQLWSLE